MWRRYDCGGLRLLAWSEYKGAVLGTLCLRGHDHGGGSYRVRRKCVECGKTASAAAGIKWRAENPDKPLEHLRSWRERNRRKVRASNSAYRQRNLHKTARYSSIRRARLAKAMPSWADLIAIQGKYTEAARLTAETGIIHEVDHIVPLKHPLVSGLHVPANLRVIPRTDNRAKSNRFDIC